MLRLYPARVPPPARWYLLLPARRSCEWGTVGSRGRVWRSVATTRRGSRSRKEKAGMGNEGLGFGGGSGGVSGYVAGEGRESGESESGNLGASAAGGSSRKG